MASATPSLKARDIEDNLDGNICRCTGFRPILDAFKSMAVDAPEDLQRKCAEYEVNQENWIEDTMQTSDKRILCCSVQLGRSARSVRSAAEPSLQAKVTTAVMTPRSMKQIVDPRQRSAYRLEPVSSGSRRSVWKMYLRRFANFNLLDSRIA